MNSSLFCGAARLRMGVQKHAARLQAVRGVSSMRTEARCDQQRHLQTSERGKPQRGMIHACTLM